MFFASWRSVWIFFYYSRMSRYNLRGINMSPFSVDRVNRVLHYDNLIIVLVCLPAVEHFHFTLAPVHVTVGAACHPFLLLVARHRTRVGRTNSVAFLAEAERHGHLEHVLPTVLGLHPARVAVYVAVRATSGLRNPPARFPAMPGCLTVFLRRPHHSLATKKKNVYIAYNTTIVNNNINLWISYIISG